jgi:hypothetical protein
MKCSCEVGWDSPLIGYFGDVTLWATPVDSRVIYLHEFGEVRYEGICWVLGVVLVVEPIVYFWRDENGRG